MTKKLVYLFAILLLVLHSYLMYKLGESKGVKRTQNQCPSLEYVKAVILKLSGSPVATASSIEVRFLKDETFFCSYEVVVLGEKVKIFFTKDGRFFALNIYPIR